MTKKSDKVILKSNIDFHPFLDLGKCDLEDWPEEIHSMDHVEHLNFGEKYLNWDLFEYQTSRNKGYNGIKNIQYNKIPTLRHVKRMCMTGNEYEWTLKGKFFYKFPNLEELDISGLEISLNFLSNLPHLKRFAFGYNRLKTFKPVLELENLESLWVAWGKIKNLSSPFASEKLKHLHIYYSEFTNLNVFKDITKMEYFYLGYHKLREIPEFFLDWTELKHLTLDNGSNYIKNKEHLRNCINLKTLSINESSFRHKYGESCDLSFISNFKKLEKIKLDTMDNFDVLRDIVKDLPNLKEIEICGILQKSILYPK